MLMCTVQRPSVHADWRGTRRTGRGVRGAVMLTPPPPTPDWRGGAGGGRKTQTYNGPRRGGPRARASVFALSLGSLLKRCLDHISRSSSAGSLEPPVVGARGVCSGLEVASARVRPPRVNASVHHGHHRAPRTDACGGGPAGEYTLWSAGTVIGIKSLRPSQGQGDGLKGQTAAALCLISRGQLRCGGLIEHPRRDRP